MDHNFFTLKDEDVIFSASNRMGQQVLHTADGTVTIPYTFDSVGDYVVHIKVHGINFVPMMEEYAKSPITVVPEFGMDVGITIAAASAIGLMILASRIRRNNRTA